jgi:hypothetical protein
MATTPDSPSVDEETMEFEENIPLEERLEQNEGYNTDIEAKSDGAYLKAGFTISNLLTHLPPSRRVEPETESVIGWTFEFPAFSEDKAEEMLISEITVIKLLVRRHASGEIEVVKELIDCEINPMIFGSQRGVVMAGSIDYASAYNQLKPFMLDDPALHISRLEGYRNWAELSFISRTDLDLMRILLEDSASGYNQYFFTGAQADFINLHNPEYVMRSENFVGKHTGIPVSSTNRAFTLKAEPFVESTTSASNNKSDLNKISREISSTARNSIGGEGASSLPLISFMIPCPEIWILEGGLFASMANTEPNFTEEDQRKMVKAFVSNEGSTDGMTVTIPGSSFPISSAGQSRQPDFFDWLRDLYNAIVGFLTGSRNT